MESGGLQASFKNQGAYSLRVRTNGNGNTEADVTKIQKLIKDKLGADLSPERIRYLDRFDISGNEIKGFNTDEWQAEPQSLLEGFLTKLTGEIKEEKKDEIVSVLMRISNPANVKESGGWANRSQNISGRLLDEFHSSLEKGIVSRFSEEHDHNGRTQDYAVHTGEVQYMRNMLGLSDENVDTDGNERIMFRVHIPDAEKQSREEDLCGRFQTLLGHEFARFTIADWRLMGRIGLGKTPLLEEGSTGQHSLLEAMLASTKGEPDNFKTQWLGEHLQDYISNLISAIRSKNDDIELWHNKTKQAIAGLMEGVEDKGDGNYSVEFDAKTSRKLSEFFGFEFQEFSDNLQPYIQPSEQEKALCKEFQTLFGPGFARFTIADWRLMERIGLMETPLLGEDNAGQHSLLEAMLASTKGEPVENKVEYKWNPLMGHISNLIDAIRRSDDSDIKKFHSLTKRTIAGLMEEADILEDKGNGNYGVKFEADTARKLSKRFGFELSQIHRLPERIRTKLARPGAELNRKDMWHLYQNAGATFNPEADSKSEIVLTDSRRLLDLGYLVGSAAGKMSERDMNKSINLVIGLNLPLLDMIESPEQEFNLPEDCPIHDNLKQTYFPENKVSYQKLYQMLADYFDIPKGTDDALTLARNWLTKAETVSDQEAMADRWIKARTTINLLSDDIEWLLDAAGYEVGMVDTDGSVRKFAAFVKSVKDIGYSSGETATVLNVLRQRGLLNRDMLDNQVVAVEPVADQTLAWGNKVTAAGVSSRLYDRSGAGLKQITINELNTFLSAMYTEKQKNTELPLETLLTDALTVSTAHQVKIDNS